MGYHYRGYKIIKGSWLANGEPCFDSANLVTTDKRLALDGLIHKNKKHSCDLVLKVAGDIPTGRPTDDNIILAVYNSYKSDKNGIWFYVLGEIDLALSFSDGVYPPSWAEVGLKASY